MKRLCKIIANILFVSAIVIPGLGCGREYTDIEHIERAQAFYDKAQYENGIIELKNALKKNPNNTQARYLLGKNYLPLGQGANAEKELRRALELGAGKESMSAPLAEALLQQGQYQQVLDEIDVPESLDAITQARLRTYRGNAWLALNQADNARIEYESALALDSMYALASVGLARLSIAKDEFDKADELIQAALAASPKEAEAWSLQARLLAGKGEKQKAAEAYTKAIEYRRLNQTDRAGRALLRIAMQEFDTAAEDVRILKEEAPGLFITHYAEGLLEFYQGNYSAAQAAFDKSLGYNGYYWRSYYFLGVAHLEQDHLDQAAQNLKHFYGQHPKSIMGRKMLALTQFRLKEYQAAKQLLVPVIESTPDDVFAQKLMGKIELSMGNPDEAVDHLTTARDLDPDSAPAHLNLGKAILTQGDTKKAIREMEKALLLDPSLSQADINIIVTHIKNQEYDAALEMAKKFAAKHPDDATPLTLMAGAYVGKGERQKAKQMLEQALTLDPSNVNAIRNLAKLEVAAGNLAGAEALYRRRLAQAPGEMESLLQLARLRQQQGDVSEMVDLLDQAITAHPQVLAPRIVLGTYYLQNGQPEKTLGLTLDMLRYYPESSRIWAVVGQAQMAVQQPFDAATSYETLVKLQPESADVQYHLATAYSQINEPDRARAAINQALRLNPQHVSSKFVLARLSVYDGNQEEADQLVKELRESHAGSTELYELEAWIALARKQPSQALATYREAGQRNPQINLWPIKIAQTQWLMGDHQASLTTLENWFKTRPDDFRVGYAIANNHLLLGQLDEAEVAFSQLLAQLPDNVFVLNNLAWLLRDKDPDAALKYAEKAHQLAPDWVEASDTLAQILLAKGDTDQAVSLLREAVAKAPTRPDLAYNLATAFASHGDIDKAQKVLNKLLEMEGDFAAKEAAQNLLNEISR